MSKYTKFIQTLDKQNALQEKQNVLQEKNIVTHSNQINKTNNSNELNKQEMDNLIKNILIEYDTYNIYDINIHNNSSSQIHNDDHSCTNQTRLKHLYSNIMYKYNLKTPIFNKENELHLTKKNIIISDEINNINDLLNIINKYPHEPLHKYNINLKALHNIKIPLQKLNNMIGMQNLKNSILDQLLYFIQEFHIQPTNSNNSNSTGDYMHTIIYGQPGTGKTEIAKILGSIYSNLGILTKGTFKKVTRSDLIAGYLGQTAIKTSNVIKEALGGVLFIDEAYALGNSEKQDSFSKECIDTLCEALSDNKDNLMVIVAGYEKELEQCFFHYNEGLNSRFVWRFKTDDYTCEDLYKIFLKMINDIEWSIDKTDKEISSQWFNKNKEHFLYYGRDIETFIAKIKIAHSKRVFGKDITLKRKITKDDLDNGLKLYLQNKPTNNNSLRKEILNGMYC
jgi:SpoVK/Ycf46/Vps4 family AAA+-type ATPase